MALETYSNLAQSTLNGAIIAGDLSLVLTDASAFPATGDFRLLVDTEIIRCTARSSNTLTVVRAQEGTTAASHSSGATVTQVLTRGGLIAVGTNLHRTDTYANIPAAGTEGRLFLPSDGISLYRDNGSAWSPWGPAFPWATPDDSLFAWVNEGGASVQTTHGGIFLQAPASGSTNGRIRKMAAPATPYTLTVYISFLHYCSAFHNSGLVFRESTSGKLKTFEYNSDTTDTLSLRTAFWTSPTAISTAAGSFSVPQCFPWMQVSDNGTNRIYRVSPDGQNWIQHYTEARTTDMTADEIGFFANAQNASVPDLGLTLMSWKIT